MNDKKRRVLFVGDDTASEALRDFYERINDGPWSSDSVRDAYMNGLAVASLNTLGRLDEEKWATALTLRSTRELLPPVVKQTEKSGSMGIIDSLRLLEKCEKAQNLNAARLAAGMLNDACAGSAVMAVTYNLINAAGTLISSGNAVDSARLNANAFNRAADSMDDSMLVFGVRSAIDAIAGAMP